VVSVAKVIDAGVAVVDFEELFLHHFGQLLGRDGPVKVRMIEVSENRATEPFRLLFDRAQIIPHGFDHGVTSLWLDHFVEVNGVYVNMILPEFVGDLFGFDEEKLVIVFKLWANFLKSLQPDLFASGFAAKLHPVPRQSVRDIRPGCRYLLFCDASRWLHRHPLFAPAEGIVIRKSEEVVSLFLYQSTIISGKSLPSLHKEWVCVFPLNHCPFSTHSTFSGSGLFHSR
jgi:hypothetical protein